MSVADRAEQAGEDADRSPWLDRGVRLGLVCYGVMHLLIAYLAVRLAFGDSAGSASSQGAFRQLAQHPPGVVTLLLVGVGFALLVVWQALEAAVGHRDLDGWARVGKRLVSAGKAVVYAVLATSAVKTAFGAAGGQQTKGLTARVMAMPAGPVIVGVVGVAILVVAGCLVFRGWSEGFRSKLETPGQTGADGQAYVLLGKIGHLAKGAAFAVVGALFLYAAFTHDPQKSGGLDVALRRVQHEPFGPAVLVLIAVGLACYGLFCFAWARHLDR